MISYTSFRLICGYKLVGVIPHKKLIMRHTNPFSSPSDAVRNDLLRKYFIVLTREYINRKLSWMRAFIMSI